MLTLLCLACKYLIIEAWQCFYSFRGISKTSHATKSLSRKELGLLLGYWSCDRLLLFDTDLVVCRLKQKDVWRSLVYISHEYEICNIGLLFSDSFNDHCGRFNYVLWNFPFPDASMLCACGIWHLLNIYMYFLPATITVKKLILNYINQ